MTPAIARQITLLDMAIGAQPPLDRCAIVWRGLRTKSEAFLRSTPVGSFAVGPTFLSTSAARRVGEFFARDVLLRIEVPAGMRVLYVPPSGVKTEEQEVLLPRGLIYEILRVDDTRVEVAAHESDE